MENELAEKWRRLNSVLCISRGSYDIVHHIKTIFAWREKNSLRAYLGDYFYELDESYKDKSIHYESIELVRYLIVKSISLRNPEALDFLVSEKNGEKVRFYALLQLLELFHGLYVLDHIATNSDFWGCIDRGQIDDRNFLSFHVFNHTFHMGKKLTDEINGSSNISNVLSLSFSSNFYEESEVMETRAFMSVFVSKLIGILRSNVFDNQFLEFYKEFEPISTDKEINKTGLGILEYLHESVAGSWAGERHLAVSKIKSLIEV